jgi:hypothetical protein
LISNVSAAISCDRSKLLLTNISQSDSMICSSTDVNPVQVGASGYFSISPTVINPNVSTTFTINLLSNAPQGYSPGLISFDAQHYVPVNVTIPIQAVQNNPSDCQINPSLISYTQSIQQGTKIPLPKITFNPINCNGNLILSASSVSIQGGIVTPEGQKPISLSQVMSDGIALNIDTTGLSSQTYSSALTITAFQKTHTIPFTIIVTTGTTPAGNFSLTSLPSCSLTSNILNLNSTYSLVCNNIQPDIKIVPKVETDFIIGTGVDSTANQYVWYFVPKSFGNTNIKAEFLYKDAPVGTPFNQEVKISSSGLATPGTNLEVLFTPSLDIAKANTEIIMQVIDNKTNSLVQNTMAYLDAKPLNKTGESYAIYLDVDKNYSLRVQGNGYNDLVRSIKLNSQPLLLSISPLIGDSLTLFNISTNAFNATIIIDEVKVNNPYYSQLSEGNHSIKAFKEGYFPIETFLYVDPALSAIISSEFKKGVTQLITLTRNTSWIVNYQKELEDTKINILSGAGKDISFIPDKNGIYTLETDLGNIISVYETKSWDGKIFNLMWYWWLAILAGIFILIGLFSNKSSSGEMPMFGGNINAG